jgi:hypothetical protein
MNEPRFHKEQREPVPVVLVIFGALFTCVAIASCVLAYALNGWF